jgi:hypothetical protein
MPKRTDAQIDGNPVERRSTSQENICFRELIRASQVLAARIERLLNDPICEQCPLEPIRVRMARAHTLSLIDELAGLVDPRDRGPAKTAAPERDETDGV